MNNTTHKNLVIVANAHHAKFFSKIRTDGKIKLEMVHDLEAELDTNHEKAGRTFNSNNSIRHGVEPHTDRRDVEKEKFARDIAAFLHEAQNQDLFEELTLLASPKMLGFLEKVLEKRIQDKIVEKFAKNIAELDDNEIREYLKAQS